MQTGRVPACRLQERPSRRDDQGASASRALSRPALPYRKERMRSLCCGAVVFGLAALVHASVASAIDGEVLIDQTKAQAGGVTPGDDPGFPVTISKSGVYKLSGNLVVPADTNG